MSQVIMHFIACPQNAQYKMYGGNLLHQVGLGHFDEPKYPRIGLLLASSYSQRVALHVSIPESY